MNESKCWWAAYVVFFGLAFDAVQAVLVCTVGMLLDMYWLCGVYFGFVLLTCLCSQYVTSKVISWAVFPYSNYFVQQNHQQEINK